MGAGRGISQSASPTNKKIGNTLKVKVTGKVVAAVHAGTNFV
jgi:hypothetical protein